MEKIRDYIYLDIDRIKSIFSQIEKGLLIQQTEGINQDNEVKANIGTNWLSNLFLDAGIEGDVIFTNKKDETKVLHDYMYTILEKKLCDENQVIKIPADYNKENYRDMLNPNSFILLECYIKIENYLKISNIIDDINELQIILGVLGLESMSQNSEINQWDETEKNLKNNSQLLDESYLKALSSFFNKFYEGKIFIKAMPFSGDFLSNFIGLIKKKYLREDIDDILFRYGSSPTFKWHVFGQISSIPAKNYNPNVQISDSKYLSIKKNWNEISRILNSSIVFKQVTANDKECWNEWGLDKNDFNILKGKLLEFSLEQLFDIIDSVSYEISIKYPSIKFTPIAIYR